MSKHKKLLSILISIVFIIETFNISATQVYADSYDANIVVEYALNKVGDSYAYGYCLAFVKDCFKNWI